MGKILNDYKEYTENELKEFDLEKLNEMHAVVSQQWIGAVKAFEGLSMLKQVGVLNVEDVFSCELEEFCKKKFDYLNRISIVIIEKQKSYGFNFLK